MQCCESRTFSKFFICHADTTFLDGQYAAFGKATEGIETVDDIVSVKTNMQGKPLYDQRMAKAEIVSDLLIAQMQRAPSALRKGLFLIKSSFFHVSCTEQAQRMYLSFSLWDISRECDCPTLYRLR